jgi:putative transposase
LDHCHSGSRWLEQAAIANLIAETIQAGEGERHFYELAGSVLMPNHVHLLILPKVPVPVIMRWLKGSTARRANLLLGRTGQPFWQDESFDHWVRNNTEFDRILQYIQENPVAAGHVFFGGTVAVVERRLAGETGCLTRVGDKIEMWKIQRPAKPPVPPASATL